MKLNKLLKTLSKPENYLVHPPKNLNKILNIIKDIHSLKKGSKKQQNEVLKGLFAPEPFAFHFLMIPQLKASIYRKIVISLHKEPKKADS